jgi:hypothetical protein
VVAVVSVETDVTSSMARRSGPKSRVSDEFNVPVNLSDCVFVVTREVVCNADQPGRGPVDALVNANRK